MHPKQFLSLIDKNTMLQNTINRVKEINAASLTIITNAEHRFLVSEQIKDLKVPVKIILEPCSRNTAAAICLAALNSNKKDTLLVLSADHDIKNQHEFNQAIGKALPLAESNHLVTLGVIPSSPHTGYGYIKAGSKIQSGYTVDEFIEKPDIDRAKKYFDNKKYYWNSGIFIFKAAKYLDELRNFSKATLDACNSSISLEEDYYEYIKIDESSFKKCPNISVDYAVMEKTRDAAVVTLNSEWSDLGSWASLWNAKQKDSNNNVIDGDVISINTSNSYISTESQILSTVGVDNLIIVSTKDAVMIANKNNLDGVKDVVAHLKSNNRPEWQFHREVYRPWGKYDSLDMGSNHQVKRITVKPGAKLSTQYHHHRSEHWVVVSGKATVTKGEETFSLKPNESTYIHVGEVHSLENKEDIDLEIIEVQTGSYLGEDDIVRIEDKYDRK